MNTDYINGETFFKTQQGSTKENYQYFYHPDHLGSSSYLTDVNGDVSQHVEYLPYGELFLEERNNKWNTPYKFNAKELDEETGLYYYGARYYDSRTSVWLSVDPLAEKNYSSSSYVYTANNPLRFIDPTGMDTLTVVKNNKGLWSINSFTQAKGYDVFRVQDGDVTKTYTFYSTSKYGERVNILNIENNDDYTLGVYNIQGAKYGHGYGFVVTPGGDGSTKVGSGKRLPSDLWTLGSSGETSKWRQIWVMNGKNNGDASARGIKVHFGYSNPALWTEGCFILSFDYTKSGKTIKFRESDTRGALMWFDFNLGASDVYKYDTHKYGGHGKLGAHFPNGIKYKMYVYDGF